MLQKRQAFLSAEALAECKGGRKYNILQGITRAVEKPQREETTAFFVVSSSMFYTYIIRSIPHPECRYIGFTSNLKRRLAEHNSGHVAHTAPLCPWKLETYIAFKDEQKARTFEAYLKTGSGRAFALRHF